MQKKTFASEPGDSGIKNGIKCIGDVNANMYIVRSDSRMKKSIIDVSEALESFVYYSPKSTSMSFRLATGLTSCMDS